MRGSALLVLLVAVTIVHNFHRILISSTIAVQQCAPLVTAQGSGRAARQYTVDDPTQDLDVGFLKLFISSITYVGKFSEN